MSGELEKSIERGAAAVGVHLDQNMTRMLLTYLSELRQWNQKINLTSLKDDKSIIINHFIDSLSVTPHLPPAGSLLDVGSGAGFPGVPIKIARPELNVTLLESKRKKINFLKQVILVLKLSGIVTLHGRLESLLSENQVIPRFDIITARAFTKLDRLLTLVQPLLQEGGCLVAMKGKEGEKELNENSHTLKSLSLETIRKVELQLPDTYKKRYLFFITKT